MPTVRGVAFGEASRSTITGFINLSDLSIDLSGASEGQFTGDAARTTVNLSGASTLQLTGRGATLSAELSGASNLQAFTYPVSEAGINVSGASKAAVSVSSALTASGASTIRYRGTPTVRQRVSGASTVQSE